MKHLLDLDQFPLDNLNSDKGQSLIKRCINDLNETGMFNLPGLVKATALSEIIEQLTPELEQNAFVHFRDHNIYFRDDIKDISQDHPALSRHQTINHTLCADQLQHSLLTVIYEWPPLADFLSQVMEKSRLYVMDDSLARVNVMAYHEGEGLNWHFDRSEFTTTLLLQSPQSGGAFQYREKLRSDKDPNYEGVGKLLCGQDQHVKTLNLTAGTLNVFKGKNTAHRVTAPEGALPRIVAVFSYFEKPGVKFSPDEQKGFYGRAIQ